MNTARGKFRANVLTWDNIMDNDDAFPDSDPYFYEKKILSEGDSWFTLAGIPTSNLLFEFRFHESTMIINIAYPGDTIIHMSKLSDNDQIREALQENRFNWSAILLSGGGNDLIDKADNILLSREERDSEIMPSVKEYCSSAKLDDLMGEIKTGFKKIAGLRNLEKKTPIVTHTYAYATPRNSPARFFGFGVSGPWIYKAFVKNDIPEQHWLELSDYLLDRLADIHLSLAEELDYFYVVDTRKKLNRALLGTTADNADWLNEFHPNSGGYKKISKEIELVLQKVAL